MPTGLRIFAPATHESRFVCVVPTIKRLFAIFWHGGISDKSQSLYLVYIVYSLLIGQLSLLLRKTVPSFNLKHSKYTRTKSDSKPFCNKCLTTKNVFFFFNIINSYNTRTHGSVLLYVNGFGDWSICHIGESRTKEHRSTEFVSNHSREQKKIIERKRGRK